MRRREHEAKIQQNFMLGSPKCAPRKSFVINNNQQLVRKIGENAHKSRAFYGLGQFALVKRTNARSSFGHDP